MHRLIIGCPFGNYVRRPYATSTLGTYTLHHRAGAIRKWWRVLRTVRYNSRTQSWINKLGLPNPGVDDITRRVNTGLNVSRDMVSVFGFSRTEWLFLVLGLNSIRPLAVELNLSCPNVKHGVLLEEVLLAVECGLSRGLTLVAKLPPVRWMDLARPLYSAGVRHFHLCNTLPTPGGGLSGKPLKQLSLWAVADVKQEWGESVDVIGGGGVTSPQDVRDYIEAGADRVAVASMLFNPLNLLRLKSLADVFPA